MYDAAEEIWPKNIFACFTGLGCNNMRKARYILGHVIQKQDNYFFGFDLDLPYILSQRACCILPDAYKSFDFANYKAVFVTPSSWKYLSGASRTVAQRRGTIPLTQLSSLIAIFPF